MAEAWCRALKYDRYEAFSAGTVAKGLNPKMVLVMKEVGIDPTIHQSSKTLQSLLDGGLSFDLVVTVCGHAAESCPVFPGKTRRVHRGFDDPPELEKRAGTPEAGLECYRRVRDEIRDFILALPGSIENH